MSRDETELIQCPNCGRIVPAAEIVATETLLEDFERVEVEDPPELPEQYRGRGLVKCYARSTLVHRECRECSDRHVM